MSGQELESDSYDVVVLGTGLAESIAAAALAKAGRSVLHLDPNEYYGSQQASLTLDELVTWSASHASTSASSSTAYSHASTSALTPTLENDRRRYALSLFPAVLPSRGPLIHTLIDSEVSKYVSFRLLESISVWDAETASAHRVPGSKEEVFKDSSIGLRDKRKLMKYLMWAAGEQYASDEILNGKEDTPFVRFLEDDFGLPRPLAEKVCWAIAHCSALEDRAAESVERTHRYLRSVGRYGPGAFLVGQYGGAGEVAQGFCRACAVYAGTYVLGPSARPDNVQLPTGAEDKIKLDLPCHPRTVTAAHLISNPHHLPESLRPDPPSISTRTANCIAILPAFPTALVRTSRSAEDGADSEEVEKEDTAVVLFPPEGDMGLVRGLIMGEGTGSCPSGQYILYLSSTVKEFTSPECLKPYLSRLAPDTLFEAYYVSQRPQYDLPASQLLPSSSGLVLLNPYSGAETLTEGMDWEAEQGQAAFWAVAGPRDQVEEGKGFFERKPDPEEEEEEGDALGPE